MLSQSVPTVSSTETVTVRPAPEGVEYDGLMGQNAERRANDALRRLSERLLRVQDEERRRIARELHDSVGQYLAIMEMNLVRALDRSGEIPENAKDILNECLTTVQRCWQETRTLSHLLHPPFLDDLGLAVALRDYVNGFSKRSGVKVELDVPEYLPRMEGDIETAVFRIVQESLTNVYRHSGSSHALVRVQCENGHFAIEVEDFGRGIAPGVLQRGTDGAEQVGVGVQGMRCRAKQLGGALEIRSDGKSTLVRAVLPLRRCP
jgi:signal transduction histidine kinase